VYAKSSAIAAAGGGLCPSCKEKAEKDAAKKERDAAKKARAEAKKQTDAKKSSLIVKEAVEKSEQA
jgi:hypothetical protein